jgi:hypothetical protein
MTVRVFGCVVLVAVCAPFADVPTYRASNPVVSDDGRYMAFQMGRSGVAAGIGYGLFLYDFGKAPTSRAR